MLVYVKRHFGYTTSMEAIYVDEDNIVGELLYSLRLEDAAWFTLEEKWAVLEPRMKIKELTKILHGDGRSPETCFEAKFRVGGALLLGEVRGRAWKGREDAMGNWRMGSYRHG